MPTIISGTTGVDQITDGTIQTADFAPGVGPVFTKEYVSPEQTITQPAGLYQLAHGLGVKPKILSFAYVCKIASDGYSIGDEVLVHSSYDTNVAGQLYGWGVTVSTTELYIRQGGTGPAVIPNKTTGAVIPFANIVANFKMIVRAWA